MATFQDDTTFSGNVTVDGTFTAAGVPSLQGLTLLVNGDAAAGTDQDPAIAMLGGDGGSELIRTTFGQDSSADKAFVKMQGGAAGTTEKSMALHVGAIATVAAVNSTLVLEAGASATNKPASLVNTGSTGVLAITGTTGVTLSDSVATLSLNTGAFTETALASIDLSPSGASTLNPAGANSIESSAAAINIGANAVAQAVNVGTGAAARVITIGNAASASVSIDAGVGALSLLSDTSSTWQVSGNAVGNLTLAIDAVNAGAGEGRLTLSADDQINLDDGTGNIQMDAGVVTETGLVSVDLTPSGAMNLRGGGASAFGDDTGYIGFDGAGAASTTGVTTLALTGSGTAQLSGTTTTIQGSVAVSAVIPDNVANGFRILEGPREYLNIGTLDAGATIALGNATTNPTLQVLGSGQITLTGNVDASAGLDVTGNITVTGTVDGRDVSTDGTKLDTIETNADVTDAANVDAAGAVMNSDTSTAGMSFVIDEDNMASNSATKVPTQQSVKAYVDAAAATIYRQVLERDSGLTQASTNTTIIRFTAAVAAAGSGCFTFTDSATDGSYITATVACMVTMVGTLNRASGTLWIKAGSALSNTLNATDLDIKGVADYATANEGVSATFYMAANDKAWIASSAAPGGSFARLNRFMVSAVSV